MTIADPTAPIHDSDRPPFHELDWPRFERLIVDLFQEEDGISYSELHGTPGPQTDYGVDVIAIRNGADGIEVASCKRYTTITAGKLAQWSQEMLDHWSGRWAARSVHRFVLATSATNLAKIDIQDQIAVEAKRFRELGMRYEVWGPAQLVRKLRPHRLLAASYLKEHWANAICGSAAMPARPVSAVPSMISSADVAQLAELQTLFSGEVSKRVDTALSEIRQGRYDEVKAFVAEMHAEGRWSQLTAEAQAMILRLEGALALSEDDLDTAQAKSDLADACYPQEEPRLVARIAAEREGARAGIAALGQPKSITGRQLLAAMLLSAGECDQARSILLALDEESPDDPETLRLLSLERLGANRRQEAFALIERVEALAPGWLATLRCGAIIRYALALSPSLGPTWLLVPNPIDADLVLSDEASQAALAAALQRLDAIPASASSEDDRLWRLAVVANTHGRRPDAILLAKELLAQRPGDAMVVAWSLIRGFGLDLAPSRAALMSAYERGADEATVKVLAMALADVGEHAAAVEFLQANIGRQDDEAAHEAKLCVARLAGQPLEGTEEALRKAQMEGDWGDADALLVKSLDADPPHPLALSIAELSASRGRFEVLFERLDRLVAFGTASAIRLACYAALNCGDHARALSLLKEHAAAFGTALPADLQRLRAEALTRAGDLRGALDAAVRLASDGGLPDQLFEAEIRARLGSISQSVPLVRRALGEGVLTSTIALQWSQVLKREAPDLARELLRSALANGIEDAHVLAAFGQSVDLGLGDEGNGLMPRLEEKAKRGDPDIKTLKIDEAQEFIKSLFEDQERIEGLYRAGAIPEHLYVRGQTETLLRLHCGANRADQPGPLEPRLIRHGARPLELPAPRPWAEWRIHIDISGLLEAYRAGLLDRLEMHPNGLTISPHLPAVLLQMRLSAPGGDAARVELLRRVIAHIDAGRIETVDWFGAAEPVVRLVDDEDAPGPALSELLGPLVSAGILTRHEATKLSGADETPVGANQDPPISLALSPPVLVKIASAGLVERLGGRVRLRVESATATRIRAEIHNCQAEAELAGIAATLSQRVGDGIAAGIYHLLPVRPTPEESDLSDGAPPERQLGDLLTVPATDGAVVWFDDRNLSGYVNAGTLPIVGVTDVVAAMEAARVLGAEEAAKIRLGLRTSGALIPFEVDEVIDPLLRAPVVHGTLIETEALRELRRAFAAIRTMESDLKFGPVEGLLHNRPDEDLIARSTMRIFSDALARVWSGPEGAMDERMARSDWLLASVRIHRLNREPPAPNVGAARRLFEAVEIGHCLDNAWELGRDKLRRLNYLHWCWERLIVPRLNGRPSIVDAVGDSLADFYRALLRNGLPELEVDQLQYERFLLARVQRLPDPIADRIRSAGVFSRLVRLSSTIKIRPRGIEAGRFWRSVRTAMRYGTARTRTTDGRTVRLRWTGEELLFTGGVRAKIDTDVPMVIAARDREQIAALHRFAEAVDLSPDELRELLKSISSVREPDKIAMLLNTSVQKSMAARRKRVDMMFKVRRGAPSIDLEPGTVPQMAWHYRIDPEAEASDRSWERLKERYGPASAYLMLCAYPAMLPSLDKLNDATLDAIISAARTPMALAMAGGLARRRGRPLEQLSSIARRFLAANENVGDLFCSILRWTWFRWRQDAECAASSVSLTLGLTWLHADWMIGTFLRHEFDLSQIRNSFPIDQIRHDALSMHALSPTGFLDQADPLITSKAVLAYHGLAEILGDRDASEILAPADLDEVNATLLFDGPNPLPVVDLILRRPEGPDALGGFMRRVPRGLLKGQVASEARDALIDQALEQIATGNDLPEWGLLNGFIIRGLTDNQGKRLVTLIRDADLFTLARPFEQSSALWRGAIAPLAWVGHDVTDFVAALSRRCAIEFGSNIGSDSQGEAALSELVETAFNAARAGTACLDEDRLCKLLWSIVTAWPQAAPQLRFFAHRVLDGMAPTSFPSFWALAVDLDRLA